MTVDYEQVGLKGSFNAGVEMGKLLPDLTATVGGAAGLGKGGATLTEKIVAKVGSKGKGGGLVNKSNLDELAHNGVKFTKENIIATGRTSTGQIFFLETRNLKVGLQHIIQEHGAEFAKMGISENQIPNVILKTVSEGKVVGYQKTGTGRQIYEVNINGQMQRIAITVSNNGYVVGANPRGAVR